jgi:hypothetical protein
MHPFQLQTVPEILKHGIHFAFILLDDCLLFPLLKHGGGNLIFEF